MNANELRDLRQGILINLYRVAPRGRTASALHRVLQSEVNCTEADVEQQLVFLGDNVRKEAADKLAPGLPPFWMITQTGMALCEQEKLV